MTEEYTAHLHHRTTPRRGPRRRSTGWPPNWRSRCSSPARVGPTCWWSRSARRWTHSPGGQKCANKIIRQGRKAWTGFCAISQHPIKDFAVLEDEFIDQRLCLGFNDAGLAEATLRWCGRDLDRHPELLRNYVDNTSPVRLIDHGDDADRQPATAPSSPGREGEAWFLDEFGGFGKVRLFEAPTAALAAAFRHQPSPLPGAPFRHPAR